MSLKEFTKEIFSRYGLTEDDIAVYLRYLRLPQATISEVYMYFEEGEIDYNAVVETTNKLVEQHFLKKIEGIVDRYIPLEPFFELFVNQSAYFVTEIAKTKDAILADQSSRFEKLENIQNKSISEVENAVSTQVNAFFADSDAKNVDKKNRIDSATARFTDTSKTIEKELHDNIEKYFSELKTDTTQLDNELKAIKQAQNASSSTMEKNIHSIVDVLNSDLKNISTSFVSNNEGGINTAKNDVNKIVADLLGDFSSRVSNLETELKKNLDGHVDRHTNIANELKPKMEQILEKYLERMDRIITDLKDRISRILSDHQNQIKNTTGKVETDLHTKLDSRHNILTDQINSYKNKALTLLENLLKTSNKFSSVAEGIATESFFFGKKKKEKYVNHWKVIEQDVASISRPFETDYVKDCNDYISDTKKTSNELKSEVTNVMTTENNGLSTETTDLNKRAQETLSAELDTLAKDMSGEIDTTLQSGVKDCSETTVKLKDSLEKSLYQHKKDYDDAINRHKDGSLRHYSDFDMDIKKKNENWVRDVESRIQNGKGDVSTESNTQITNINDFSAKHTKTVEDRLNKIRSDFNNSKSFTSQKIDAEIQLWNGEAGDMNQMLSATLEDHKVKYKDNAGALQNSLSNTTRDTTQNVKDAIADFTLQFMNSIDDATELAETNESKLKDIHDASSLIPEISKATTWHTIGTKPLIAAIKDAVYRTKSSIIIVMPVVIPEVLQVISEFAYQRKAARFMLTSHWDMNQYTPIIKKMLQLGNIQFRNLSQQGEYFLVTRDVEEVIISPYVPNKEHEMISIISNQEAYCKLYSSFIGPIFQANSRPIKL